MAGDDKRVAALVEASIEIMVKENYEPHFSGVSRIAEMESKLFIARYDALIAYDRAKEFRQRYPETFEMFDRVSTKVGIAILPIDMILFCPAPGCGRQHIDAPEDDSGWTNPPHKSHLCHSCGHVWRPAGVPTNGVAQIPFGKKDSNLVVRGRAFFK